MEEDLKLPSAVNVLGYWVKIHYVKHLKGSPNEILFGLFEPEKNRITIKKTDSEEMYKTLIHEISHAMIHYSGLRQVINAKQEEAFCCLAEYFTKLFSLRNSKSIRWSKTRAK